MEHSYIARAEFHSHHSFCYHVHHVPRYLIYNHHHYRSHNPDQNLHLTWIAAHFTPLSTRSACPSGTITWVRQWIIFNFKPSLSNFCLSIFCYIPLLLFTCPRGIITLKGYQTIFNFKPPLFVSQFYLP